MDIDTMYRICRRLQSTHKIITNSCSAHRSQSSVCGRLFSLPLNACSICACAQEFGEGLERQCESCGVSVRMHVLEKNAKNSTDPHDRAEKSVLGAGARLLPPCC